MTSIRASRVATVAGTAAVVVAAQALVQLAGAAPAAALPGYQIVQASSATDSRKTMQNSVAHLRSPGKAAPAQPATSPVDLPA